MQATDGTRAAPKGASAYYQSYLWKLRETGTLRAIGPAAVAVLMALITRVNQQWKCWPSVAQLCDDTGLSERHVQRGSAVLARLGMIERHQPHQASTTIVRFTRIVPELQKKPRVRSGLSCAHGVPPVAPRGATHGTRKKPTPRILTAVITAAGPQAPGVAAVIEALKKAGLSKSVAAQLVEKFGAEACTEAVRVIGTRRNVRNPAGAIRQILTDDAQGLSEAAMGRESARIAKERQNRSQADGAAKKRAAMEAEEAQVERFRSLPVAELRRWHRAAAAQLAEAGVGERIIAPLASWEAGKPLGPAFALWQKENPGRSR